MMNRGFGLYVFLFRLQMCYIKEMSMRFNLERVYVIRNTMILYHITQDVCIFDLSNNT